MTQWVVNYFNSTDPGVPTSSGTSNAFQTISGDPITISSKMPLILQRQGHSMLVVGYEVLKSEVTQLLIFDAFLFVGFLTL
jgi:hypothetical protein